MERYLIYTCEQIFHGLHGINTIDVIEGDYEEAQEFAIDSSYDLMNSYSDIQHELETSVQELMADDWEEDHAWEEVTTANLEYYLYKIDETKAKDLSTDFLNNLAHRDYDEFRNQYCIPE
jgi:hypothetical protein